MVRIGSISPCGLCNAGCIKQTVMVGISAALLAIVYSQLSKNGHFSMGQRQLEPLSMPNLGFQNLLEIPKLPFIPSLFSMKSDLDLTQEITSLNANGLNRLHQASKDGDLERVEELAHALIANGGDLEARSRTGFTAIELAGGKDRKKIIECLIQNGAKIRKENYQSFPDLRALMMDGNLPLLRAFVKAGIDPFAPILQGKLIPFQFALEGGYIDSLKIFTGAESHPAFATCQTVDQFLKALFPKLTEEEILSDLEQLPDSPEIKDLKDRFLSMKASKEINPEEFTDVNDLISHLKETNPRFASAWDLLNKNQPVVIKTGRYPYASYDEKTHCIFLTRTCSEPLDQQIYRVLSWGLYQDEMVQVEKEAQERAFSLNEYLARSSSIRMKSWVLEKEIKGESTPEIASRASLYVNTNLNCWFQEWKLHHATPFFKNNQNWVKARLESLREIS